MSAIKIVKASTHPRWYVKHDYHDHSKDIPVNAEDFAITTFFTSSEAHDKLRVVRFPLKLHMLLLSAEIEGFNHIISWQEHGRAFKIHKDKEFVERVLPLYFSHKNLLSFHRQLNLYGFLKITQGRDKGAHYHELFLREKYFLARKIIRKKVKGTFVRGLPNPSDEPDFYALPFIDTAACLLQDQARVKNTASYFPHIQYKEMGDEDSYDLLLEHDPYNTAVSEELFCCSANEVYSSSQGVETFTSTDETKNAAKIDQHILSDISSEENGDEDFYDFLVEHDPFNTFVSEESFFCSDNELYSSSQEIETSINRDETKNAANIHEHILSDISLEDDLSNPNQHYSLLEYIDTCILLQLVIDSL
jgi:hypothetical protein